MTSVEVSTVKGPTAGPPPSRLALAMRTAAGLAQAAATWAVELNSDTLPRVLINKTYYAEISKNARAKKDKEYLSEQMNTANWLIKAMDQRAQTILKVGMEIIEQQEAFFNYGVEFLKPLVLKDIAEVIGMHESTVSRVTSNKYLGTPRGVFELKYFFTSGVSSSDGGAEFSSEAVKARLRNLIDAEKIGRAHV